MNNEKPTSLEFRLLTPSWELSLIEFFNWINNSDVKTYFHPHPFTPQELLGVNFTPQECFFTLLKFS